MGKDLQTRNGQNRLAIWAGRISECRSSGQNVKAWCRENGVCEQTYYKWQKRLFEMAKAQQEAQFAEVTPVQPVRCGNVAVTVRISGAEGEEHHPRQLCYTGSHCPYHDPEIRYGQPAVSAGAGN